MLLDQEFLLINIEKSIWKLFVVELALDEVRNERMMPRVIDFEVDIFEVSAENSSDLELEHVMKTCASCVLSSVHPDQLLAKNRSKIFLLFDDLDSLRRDEGNVPIDGDNILQDAKDLSEGHSNFYLRQVRIDDLNFLEGRVHTSMHDSWVHYLHSWIGDGVNMHFEEVLTLHIKTFEHQVVVNDPRRFVQTTGIDFVNLDSRSSLSSSNSSQADGQLVINSQHDT